MLSSSPVTDLSTRSGWLRKFIEATLAAIAVVNSLLLVLEVAPREWLMSIDPSVFDWIMGGSLVLPLLFAIPYSTWWHRKEKKQEGYSLYRHAVLRAILRYWLAFNLATYGFAKLLKTQFDQSFHREDTLAGAMSGFNLTWNYFNHSYVMACIIGLLQIIGGTLLLFRRTTLLGTAMLLPIMVNILLINLFYDIAQGAFINSVLFTLGLTYLLLVRWPELKRVFLQTGSALPGFRRPWMGWIVRPLILLASFWMIYHFVLRDKRTALVGKWKIDTLIRNQDTVKGDAWLKDSLAWQTVYIEKGDYMIFCPNPYLFDPKRSVWVSYNYAGPTQPIRTVFYNGQEPGDTTEVRISGFSEKKMTWTTRRGKDTLQLVLTKLK
jgi:hypothetical protein